MKRKSAISCFALLFVISLVLDACNLPGPHPIAPPTAQTNPDISVGMVVPQNGSVYALGSTITIGGLALQSPLATAWEFLINGASFAPNSIDVGGFYGQWTPPNAGEYYIQAKVTLSNGTMAISEPIRVCVTSLIDVMEGGSGYLGPCPLATPISNPASSGNVALFAIAAPSAITFSTYIECPMENPTVTFIANVDDPQDLVALVSVVFPNARGSYLAYNFLNWVTTRPVNQKEYRATVEIPRAFAYDDSIQWWVKAYGRAGEQLQVTRDLIVINHAECSSQSIQIAPSETPTLTPTPGILYIVPPTKKPKDDDGGDEPPPPTEPPTSEPAPCNPLIRVCP